MRTAVMLLTEMFPRYRQPVSVQVKLQYVWAFPLEFRRWSCAPGYLGASHGYWKESALTESIALYDDKDRMLGWSYGMEVSWYGYSFGGMKGESGKFTHDSHKGGVLHHLSTWTLISV